MSNYIALDYGTQKTGLAYSVESFSFAHSTIPTSTLLHALPTFISEKKATKVIIGMPYNIDGTISKHGKRVQAFVKKLESIVTVPVILHDERLSTSEARISFDDIGVEGDIDAEAARLILVSYIEQTIN